MTLYAIRFVHKISPSPRDIHNTLVRVAQDDESSRVALGRALRGVGALPAGGRLNSVRAGGGRLVAFPAASPWHSIILTPADETIVECYRHRPGTVLEVRGDSNTYAIGEHTPREPYGLTRMWRLPVDVRDFDRPFCGDSPPHVLTWVKLWFTGEPDSAGRVRHAEIITP